MAWNCLSWFTPTGTDDDTKTTPSTPRPDDLSRPSTVGPSTSCAAETERVNSKKQTKEDLSGHDQLAKDKKKLNLNLNFEAGSSSQSEICIQDRPSFSLEELQGATENFSSECLGEGGFGKVYKGYLDKVKQNAAIKKLSRKGVQGIREFIMEVEVLRKVDHPNLVKLLGFCAEKEHRLLVYEYMTLGSLDAHLFDHSPHSPPLDWKIRLKIAIDVASGLEYLHDKMIPGIIHLDLKSANILLGEGYHAKLSDFGTARVDPADDETDVSTMVIGSSGYLAPEYRNTGHSTHKSDIYSFGVVLLELITGRSAYDPARPLIERNLVDWIRFFFMIKDVEKLVELADPRLGGQYNKESLNGALDLAERCVDSEAIMRPVIAEVVQALKKCHSL